MKNPTESLEHASAPDSGGTDSGAGRRRLHRAERTGGVDRRLRYGQKPSGDGLVSGRVPTMDAARQFVAAAMAGKTAVASNAPYLEECGIAALPGVRTGIREVGELTEVCARVDIGITSADYALSDTGTLVVIASPAESRLVSLLPPAHLAVVPVERILTGLDELFTLLPDPAAQTSSMVLITGPSRTADIEQILVRGVHGPGQVTVVIVG